MECYKAALLFVLLSSNASPQVVRSWVTTNDQSVLMKSQAPVAFTPGVTAGLPTIMVSDATTFQTIEGFGASMTDSAAFLLNEKVPPAALHGVMESLFDHDNGIGLSFLRNPIGASDITRYDYSYDDMPAGASDPSLSGFSIAHDQTDIIPLLQAARAINPQLKLLITPWSPPGWMKTSGSMIGGALDPAFYSPFTSYLVNTLQAYASAGLPIDYLTLQNEPLNVPTDYPGALLPAAAELSLLKGYVLPALAANSPGTRVMIFDHNWDVPAYPQALLSDPAIAASSQVAGVAWHWYAGTAGSMTTIHNQFPAVPQYVTEASGGTWNANELQSDFEVMIHSLRNWASSYVKWSLALDENRGPHTGGCTQCSAPLTIDQTTGAVNYNIEYYTLGQFSKFILPGAVRVWSSNAPGIISAAFLNPDRKTRVMVAYNDSLVAETFQVAWNAQSFTYTLPSLSAVTFEWATPAAATACVAPQGLATAGFRLRSPKQCWTYSIPATAQVQASSYNNVLNLETEGTGDAGGGFDLGYASDGSWAEYRNLDFGSGVATVTTRVSGSGGTLEFHLASPSGPLIAQVAAPATGGWQTWNTVSTPVTGARGVNPVYVVFHGGVNLNWFQFQ